MEILKNTLDAVDRTKCSRVLLKFLTGGKEFAVGEPDCDGERWL